MLKIRLHKLIALAIACFIILHFSSCQRDEAEILSSSEMRKVLVDLHLLEGMFSATQPPLTEREQVYYYEALFRKHEITRADFDSSLVYYTRNPKIYERIYSRVLADLNLLNEEVLGGKYREIIPDSILFKPYRNNLWYKADSLIVKHDSIRKQLNFSIKDPSLMIRDVYWWSFRIRISPADTTRNPYAVLRLHYADGSVDTLSKNLKNDSILRRYSFRIPAFRNRRIDSLSGNFMKGSVYAKKAAVRIDSIRFFREYVPLWQDSLSSHIDSLLLLHDSLAVKKIPVDDRLQTNPPPVRPGKAAPTTSQLKPGEMSR